MPTCSAKIHLNIECSSDVPLVGGLCEPHKDMYWGKSASPGSSRKPRTVEEIQEYIHSKLIPSLPKENINGEIPSIEESIAVFVPPPLPYRDD